MNPIEDENQEIMVDTGGSFTNPALEIHEEEDNQLSSQQHHHHHPYHHPHPPPHPLHSPPQSPPQPPPPFMVDPATGPRSPQSQTSRQEDESDIYGGSITSGVLV